MAISSLKTKQKSRLRFFREFHFGINIDTTSRLVRYFTTISANFDCIIGDVVNDLQCYVSKMEVEMDPGGSLRRIQSTT
ncbi:hypothetical protein TNCV_1053441 [Trichonephila clavipes]|nr:hypothetical protein TNCV_1053441 [Trichonephila clavipes]